MKKSITLFLLATMGCSLLACGKQDAATSSTAVGMNDISPENKISSDAAYWGYSFEELQEEADVIARVSVVDELTSENSYTQTDDSGLVSYAGSLREVKPLEIYKDNIGLNMDKTFLVQDDAAIYLSNGEYYYEALNDAIPLVKDDTYLLYLQKQENSFEHALVIMSGYNGKIHLENPSECEQYNDIVQKTIQEYHLEEYVKN